VVWSRLVEVFSWTSVVNIKSTILVDKCIIWESHLQHKFVDELLMGERGIST